MKPHHLKFYEYCELKDKFGEAVAVVGQLNRTLQEPVAVGMLQPGDVVFAIAILQ